jgi:hypothetical protein
LEGDKFSKVEAEIKLMTNTCENPLKLTYSKQFLVGYKVNKPSDQSGEYVDKKIADDLLKALINLRERCTKHDSEFNMPELNDAITSALEV